VPPPPLGGAEPAPAATFRGGGAGARAVGGLDVDPYACVPAPARAAGVERFGEVPGSGYRRAPSLVRRIDDQVVQLTPLLDAVLAELDGQRTYGQVASAVASRTDLALAPEDVAFLCEEKLRPLGLLRGPDGTEPTPAKANPLLALRCRFVVSDPAVTRRLTRPFAALFHPGIVAVVLAAFVASTGWLLFERGLASATSAAFSDPLLLLTIFALTVVSAGFHEFGHAAAYRYGGATPGAMGVGLYLLWPAFYTDVSDSYRLGRGGRLRVDLGGLYFNALFAVGTFAVWAATGAEALLLLIVSQLLQMVRQLVPLVRFDGYHILADLTGVPDLFHHIGPTLRGLLPKRWRSTTEPALKPWARATVRLWVAVVVPVLATVLVLLVVALPRVAVTAWESLQLQWQVLGANWAERAYAEVGVRWLSIAALLVPLLSMTYLLARVARRAGRWLVAFGARSRGRRVAAIGVGFALSAAVAVAWWQPGAFEPVQPVDGAGRVQDGLPFLAAGPDDEEQEPALVQATAGAPAGAVARAGSPAGSAAGPAAGSVATGATAAPRAALAPGGAGPGGTAVGAQPRPRPEPPQAPPGGGPRPEPPAPPPGPPVPPRDGWPFPWDAPPPVAPGSDRASVINLRDGSAQRDVSIAARWIEDGGPVFTRNEAIAYANCTDCSSLAAAFQVVYIVGQANIIVPINTAVAANYDCERCKTHAIADQLVVTLVERPDGRTRGALNRAIADLRATAARARTTGELQLAFRDTRARLLGLLDDAQLIWLSEELDEDREDGIPDDEVEGTPTDPSSDPAEDVDEDPAALDGEETAADAGEGDAGDAGAVEDGDRAADGPDDGDPAAGGAPGDGPAEEATTGGGTAEDGATDTTGGASGDEGTTGDGTSDEDGTTAGPSADDEEAATTSSDCAGADGEADRAEDADPADDPDRTDAADCEDAPANGEDGAATTRTAVTTEQARRRRRTTAGARVPARR
jgi:putative peptide zinc metalloprotease protein